MLSEEDKFDSFGNYFEEDENGEVTFISAEQYQDELKKNPKLAVLDKKQIELKAKDFLKRYQSRLDVGEASTELSKVYNYAKTVVYKVVSAEKYEIKYSTKSSLKGAKTKIVSSNKIFLKGLKKNTKYYASVRAYTKINGEKVYTSSKKIYFKTKKLKKCGFFHAFLILY